MKKIAIVVAIGGLTSLLFVYSSGTNVDAQGACPEGTFPNPSNPTECIPNPAVDPGATYCEFDEPFYIHPGIDIRPDQGQSNSGYVYSTHAGWVTYAGPAPVHMQERGWMVQIESDINRDNVADVITRYSHLASDSIMINDVRYRRQSFTPEFFASLLENSDDIDKLPFGYGPYVARNQLIGMVGSTGTSGGNVHVQYEIVTGRHRLLYGMGLDTDVPWACCDDPYVETNCVPADQPPGFFFPYNYREVGTSVDAPDYANGGMVTPPPALTPIISPTPEATPTPGPTDAPQPTDPPGSPPPPPECSENGCTTGRGHDMASNRDLNNRSVCIENGQVVVRSWEVDGVVCGGDWQMMASTPPDCAAQCGGWHGYNIVTGGAICGCNDVTSATILFANGPCAQESVTVTVCE